MDPLDGLIKNLSRMPGVGKKSAQRLAFFFLQADKRYTEQLGEQIKTIQDVIKSCSQCGNFTETDPCSLCQDVKRDKATICVVEQPQDLITIQSTGEYKGLFFVLNGVISPMDGIGPDDLKLGLLIKRVKEEQIKEVILATNPTIEGDTTALYIYRMLQDANVRVTRLASGLPVGGDLEYADKQTISRSFNARRDINM